MIASLMSTVLLGQQEPTFADLQAIDASLFKNGYAMVTYKIDVPAGNQFYIKEPPQGTLGTLWLYTDKGGTISELVMTKVEDTTTTTVTAQSMVELLALNKNKPADLTIMSEGKEVIFKNIKIVETNAQITIFDTGESRMTLATGRIIAFSLPGATYTKQQTEKKQIPALRLKTNGTKSVYLFALQQGLTWSPAYNVDISDEKKLTFTAKSTIINDLVDLNVPEARFISGFPNIQFLGTPDPLTFYQAANDFVNQSAGRLGGGGGGFGAQRLDNTRAYRPEMDAGALADSFNVNNLEGFQAEDLYFYKQPNVNLKKGDRGYYVMFQSEAEYSHVYTLDIAVGAQSDTRQAPVPVERTNAWHKLKFKNTTGRPLTTAPALITQNGQMLAQELVTYTPSGAEMLLPITQALDIASILKEEEVERERGTTQDSNGRPVHDTLSIKGALEITNFKSKKIDLVITKDIIGEVTQTNRNGKATKDARSRNGLNPTTTIRWELSLEPGAKVDLSYAYKIVIPTRG